MRPTEHPSDFQGEREALKRSGHIAAAELSRRGVGGAVYASSNGFHCVFCGTGDSRDPRGSVSGPERYIHDPECPWESFVSAWNGFPS